LVAADRSFAQVAAGSQWNGTPVAEAEMQKEDTSVPTGSEEGDTAAADIVRERLQDLGDMLIALKARPTTEARAARIIEVSAEMSAARREITALGPPQRQIRTLTRSLAATKAKLIKASAVRDALSKHLDAEKDRLKGLFDGTVAIGEQISELEHQLEVLGAAEAASQPQPAAKKVSAEAICKKVTIHRGKQPLAPEDLTPEEFSAILDSFVAAQAARAAPVKRRPTAFAMSPTDSRERASTLAESDGDMTADSDDDMMSADLLVDSKSTAAAEANWLPFPTTGSYEASTVLHKVAFKKQWMEAKRVALSRVGI
jgi:hypothetical protein